MTDHLARNGVFVRSLLVQRFAALSARKLASVCAIFAAGLLALPSAQLSPALAAVSCGASWEQGTLDSSGSWTAGSGTDYRVVCTADTDGETFGPDVLPEPVPGAVREVFDLSDSNIDHASSMGGLDDVETASPGVVLTGRLDASPGRHAVEANIGGFSSGSEGADFVLESFAIIVTTGDFRRGIYLRNTDSAHTGRIEAINRGSISTSGDLFAEGMRVISSATNAQAEVRAVNTGTVTTTGEGSRGVYVRMQGSTTAGTATAINEGTVTTSGDTGIWVDTNDNNRRYAILRTASVCKATGPVTRMRPTRPVAPSK